MQGCCAQHTDSCCCWLCALFACRFEFFAGDDVFLGAAAKAYAAEGQDWRRSYYLPTSADLAITKLRQWLDKYSGGRLPFPKHMQVGVKSSCHCGCLSEQAQRTLLTTNTGVCRGPDSNTAACPPVCTCFL